MPKVLNHPSPPREPRPALPRGGTAGPSGAQRGLEDNLPPCGDKAPFSGLSAAQHKKRTLSCLGTVALNGLFMASKRNTSGAVFHGRWKGPGLWAAGGLLAGNALCLGPRPPPTRHPLPHWPGSFSKYRGLWAPPPWSLHTRGQLCEPGAHEGQGSFLCSEVSSSSSRL